MTVMASGPLLLALDQGTTSTRAILFDIAGTPLRMAQRELRQIYPATGWVEHDPEEIWEASVSVLREASGDTLPAAIGIANQRETVLLLGPREWRLPAQRHRLAGPAHGARLRPASRGGAGALRCRAQRPPDRPLFLGDQARLADRCPARRARAE